MQLLLCFFVVLLFAGCGSASGNWSKQYDPIPPGAHITPTHSIQDASLAEMKRFPEAGISIVATGKGPAVNSAGEPTHLEPGERVEIVSIDLDRNTALVRRVAYNSFATVTREGLTARGP